MKKLVKVLAMILALSMVFALAACGGNNATQQTPSENSAPAAGEGDVAPAAEAPAITFTISTDAANRTQYCELFVKNLDEASNGRIKGEVLAANSLGSCNDMCQMLQLGTLDIMLSDDMSVDSNLNGALGFAWLPGLVADYEEADQYYNFGWIGQKCAEIMLENDLVRMSSFCNGFRQVGNIVRPVTEMSDLAGLKIRTPAVSSIVDFYEMCGALPVMISGSEVLSALQTGTVDGLDNSVYNYINQGVTDVVKYICELNYCYAGGCFIAGTPFWDTLSAEDQALFLECAQAASDVFINDFRSETDRILQEGVDNGQWEITQPSEEMQAALQEIYTQIWEQSRELYGDEILDVIISGQYKELSK